MAIISFSGMISGARGTVGGVTYSANGSTPYAKQWSKPQNRRTPIQTVRRSYITNSGVLWAALTQTVRDDWETWAALPAQELTNSLGQAYYISGFAWYTSTTAARALTGFAASTASPSSPTLTTPSGITLVVQPAADGASTITPVAGDYTSPNKVAVLFLGVVFSQARTSPPTSMRYIWSAFAPASTPFDISTAIYAAFGDPIPGQRVFYALHMQSGTGRRGPALTGFVDVT